ncbi:MAG TPA: sigma-70 family RNA polymerase sigma factor [Planctomycetota bacterium]
MTIPDQANAAAEHDVCDQVATAAAAEQRLLLGLQRRDGDAYAVLVREHGRQMLLTARRMLGNEEDARDVMQEAFVAAFRAIDTFEAKSRLTTWLHRIVVNSALMKLRSRRCRPACSIEDLLPRFGEDGHHLEPPCPRSGSAERELDRSEVRARVRAAIDELPDNYREVILLRDIEELSTDEASRMLSISSNALKIRLHRARQALRTLLERQREDRHHDLP